MKRPLADADAGCTVPTAADKDGKKIKQEAVEEEPREMLREVEAVLMDENLLYEVLRRVDDGRTLAKAACVSRQWKRTAHDERIWELICTRNYQRSPMQLRAIVSALGGFRRLFSSHLWPLLNPATASSSAPPYRLSTWPCLSPALAPGMTRSNARWGKDERKLDALSSPAKTITSPLSPHRSPASRSNGFAVGRMSKMAVTPVSTTMTTAKGLRTVITPLSSKPSAKLERFLSSCDRDVTADVTRYVLNIHAFLSPLLNIEV